LFEKPQTWGRETIEYSNPEQARAEGNEGPKWGRKGVVGWGVKGTFGGRGDDVGLAVLQRGEVNQAMEKNDKGLWVRKKAPDKGEDDDEDAPSKGHWRCSLCRKETSVTMEFCRKFECNGVRPATAAANPDAFRGSNPHEDPRLEVAAARGRGTQDARKLALKALEERRRKEQQEKEKRGMRPQGGFRGERGGTTLNSGSMQVRAAPRLGGAGRYQQGVQKSDEEAKRIVAKAVGGAVEASGFVRIEDSGTSHTGPAKTGDRAGKRSSKGEAATWDTLEADIADGAASRSRSRSRDSGGSGEFAWQSPGRSRSSSPAAATGSGVVVDFF